MTVRELIESLSKFDPNTKVIVQDAAANYDHIRPRDIELVMMAEDTDGHLHHTYQDDEADPDLTVSVMVVIGL